MSLVCIYDETFCLITKYNMYKGNKLLVLKTKTIKLDLYLYCNYIL